ncbi:MAG: hypothetical protein ACRDWA_03920 [Acidimicrobiia bacterium]
MTRDTSRQNLDDDHQLLIFMVEVTVLFLDACSLRIDNLLFMRRW